MFVANTTNANKAKNGSGKHFVHSTNIDMFIYARFIVVVLFIYFFTKSIGATLFFLLPRWTEVYYEEDGRKMLFIVACFFSLSLNCISNSKERLTANGFQLFPRDDEASCKLRSLSVLIFGGDKFNYTAVAPSAAAWGFIQLLTFVPIRNSRNEWAPREDSSPNVVLLKTWWYTITFITNFDESSSSCYNYMVLPPLQWKYLVWLWRQIKNRWR